MLSAQVRPRKYQTYEKVLRREQELSVEQIFYLELYLEPGSCGGNTQSTGPNVPAGGNRANDIHCFQSRFKEMIAYK